MKGGGNALRMGRRDSPGGRPLEAGAEPLHLFLQIVQAPAELVHHWAPSLHSRDPGSGKCGRTRKGGGRGGVSPAHEKGRQEQSITKQAKAPEVSNPGPCPHLPPLDLQVEGLEALRLSPASHPDDLAHAGVQQALEERVERVVGQAHHQQRPNVNAEPDVGEQRPHKLHAEVGLACKSSRRSGDAFERQALSPLMKPSEPPQTL